MIMKKTYNQPQVKMLSVMANQSVLLLGSNSGPQPQAAPARRSTVSASPEFRR